MGAMDSTTDPIEDGAAARWKRVRELVEAALDRPDGERAAFVAEQAGTDEALRAEVLELLELDTQEGLEPSGKGFGKLPLVRREAELPELGRWKALRELGSGGMGTVYLGVRADGQFKQRVAIKVIKRGMDSEEVLLRFERERQVLASLDHPCIARLIDGGISEDGRPYLVIEYVEGEVLDRWCDSQRLSLRERIELFCKICEAVEDAHRSLVVHRDLKPGNVLVDGQGRPRLLDFGIAKVLDPAKGNQTVELTASPMRMMTPAYASPEQIRGQQITTASDIYSLGAMLFHLLAGQPPFDLRTSSAVEVERLVCDTEAPSCSQVLLAADGVEEGLCERLAELRRSSPRNLARSLRGDLDTVLAKAMRKEPRRRYATAGELREDLERWLNGLPVQARPDTLGYRTSKFVRRHRAGVLAASTALLALVVGLLVSLWQYREASRVGLALAEEVAEGDRRNEELQRLNLELEEERETAQSRAEKLEVLSEVLRERTEEAATARGVAENRAEKLEVLYADLVKEQARARAAQAEAQSAQEEAEAQRRLAVQRTDEVRDFATTLIFDVHRALAPLEGAFEARKLIVEKGLVHLDGLANSGELEDDPQLAREISGGYLRLAALQGDETEDSLGDPEAAIQTIGKAVDIGEKLQEQYPEDLSCDFSLGSALMRRGDALRLAGRVEEARGDYKRAAELCGLHEEGTSASAGRNYVLNSCLLRLGGEAREAGELELARGYLDEALWRIEELAARVPGTASDLALVFFEQAQLEQAAGELEVALVAYEEGEQVLRDLIEPASAGAAHGLVRMLHTKQLARGSLLLDMGRVEEALQLARELEAYFRSLAGAASSENLQPARLLVGSLDLLARACGDHGEWEAAFGAGGEAVEEATRLVEQQPGNAFLGQDLARAHLRMGLLAEARGLLLDAEDALREACELFDAEVRRDPDSPQGLRNLAVARCSLARTSFALAERDGLGPSERGQWLRRTRSLLLEASTAQAQLREISQSLPSDEASSAEVQAELQRCEEALAALGR